MKLLKLLLSLVALLSTSVFADQYAVIVDAGSSGSRLHLFKYETDQAVPQITDIYSEKNKLPLSSFANHPQDAGASLQTLLDHAKQKLDALSVDSTQVTVDVLATAGMRLVETSQQKAIYNNVKTTLLTAKQFSVGDVETIEGKMEGLYGWLDINYLQRNFQNHTDTVGSLDMGGASTQIAFATNDVSKPEDETELTINSTHYNVFSKSFLGMGQDQARAKVSENQVGNTCYPTGFLINPNVVGKFAADTCAVIYNFFIESNLVSEKIISTADKPFLAYSGAYYTFNFLNVDKSPNPEVVLSSIYHVCQKNSWDELKKLYPTVDEKYLSSYCANSVYLYDLFYEAYQLKNDQLTVASKIGNQEIDWTLGALLFKLIERRA